ncbi:MAG TPA: LamG domain-containing protein [Bryobacteraceae bacterium]
MEYQYYRSITVDHTKVPNTDQVDFPVLVKAIDASLATVENGGHVRNANGYDLVFATDPAGANLLAWEVQSYDPTSGAIVAWVNIPTLSHTSDTTIFLCYANDSVTTDLSNKAGTWNGDYAGVWHLTGNSAAQLADSTAAADNGAALGTISIGSGPISGAIAIAGGSGNGVTIGHAKTLNLGNVLTLSAWVNPASLNGRLGIFTTRSGNAPGSWQLEAGSLDGSVSNALGVAGVNTWDAIAPSNSATIGAWTQVVFTRNGGDASNALYVNGSPSAIRIPAAAQAYAFADNLDDKQIGMGTANQQSWNGLLAEFRLSKVARSADWVAAEYANQSSPSTFYALGAEIARTTPALAWNIPDPIRRGIPLGSAQLDATAPISGTFVYDPPAGTVLDEGSQTLSVTFTPDDEAHYTEATASVALRVDPCYYPQFLNGMIAQAGSQPTRSFQSATNDVDCGFRQEFAWSAGGLQGYPPAPLYNWTIPYWMLIEDEIQTLESFFSSMKGRSGAFSYLDPGGNLCQYSEDFTQPAWEKSGAVVSQNGGVSDPFGGTDGSTLTASGADASIAATVLPDGAAAGFILCGSVWVKAATAQSLQIGFTDDAGISLQSQTWQLAGGIWTRISCRTVLTVSSQVMLRIGGGGTWASSAALSLYGAQCAPTLTPAGYTKTPGDYGLHRNVQFDMDTLTITKMSDNRNAATVKLREFRINT